MDNENTKAINQQPTNSTPGETGGSKTFTQEEVNRIVSERLAKEKAKAEPKEDEREQALKARESRLDCREYIANKGYPAELLDMLDTSDAEKFRASVDKLVQLFPSREVVSRVDSGANHFQAVRPDEIANAFKPPKI